MAADVPAMLARIKELEAQTQAREAQLLEQEKQLSTLKAGTKKRPRLCGLNDVKTLGTKLQALKDPHVRFCAKYGDGQSNPKTLPVRTKCIEFLNRVYTMYEEEFKEYLEAIEGEEAPKAKKAKK